LARLRPVSHRTVLADEWCLRRLRRTLAPAPLLMKAVAIRSEELSLPVVVTIRLHPASSLLAAPHRDANHLRPRSLPAQSLKARALPVMERRVAKPVMAWREVAKTCPVLAGPLGTRALQVWERARSSLVIRRCALRVKALVGSLPKQRPLRY
jgi:hypothetical protein